MKKVVSILIITKLFFIKLITANNASYIILSNQQMRAKQLAILANNVANTNTIGFEADLLVINNYDITVNKGKNNSFVIADATYLSPDQGALNNTNRNLDFAIIGNGYFKILTPKGIRYTLNGNSFINNNRILVNIDGYPYSSIDGDVIIIPEEASLIEISQDGIIFADKEEVAQIGVFSFADKYALNKEGNYLLTSKNNEDLPANNYSIIQGSLKASNVNSVQVMADMIELQRSLELSNNIMSNINDLEKNTVQRITKQ